MGSPRWRTWRSGFIWLCYGRGEWHVVDPWRGVGNGTDQINTVERANVWQCCLWWSRSIYVWRWRVDSGSSLERAWVWGHECQKATLCCYHWGCDLLLGWFNRCVCCFAHPSTRVVCTCESVVVLLFLTIAVSHTFLCAFCFVYLHAAFCQNDKTHTHANKTVCKYVYAYVYGYMFWRIAQNADIHQHQKAHTPRKLRKRIVGIHTDTLAGLQ
jgi:hypothetical protein